MTRPAPEHCVQIDRAYGAAICEEIGERLRTRLNRESVRLPARLLGLVAQFREGRLADAAKRIA